MNLVYAKHTPSDRCGVAYFAHTLSQLLSGRLVHDFRGFGRCQRFFVNLDILELGSEDVRNLVEFMKSDAVGQKILVMHDYRFSYLEDDLIDLSDKIINLSGEPELTKRSPEKTLELFTPALIPPPTLKLSGDPDSPYTLAFGFFNARKKSFSMYLQFYEYMLSKYPGWRHIVVASGHTGDESGDDKALRRLLSSDKVMFLEFTPNTLLSELVHGSQLGVCFYPTGIMSNNTTPMSFFLQKKSVVTNYGALTSAQLKKMTYNFDEIRSIDFTNRELLITKGQEVHKIYSENFSWPIFLDQMDLFLSRPAETWVRAQKNQK